MLEDYYLIACFELKKAAINLHSHIVRICNVHIHENTTLFLSNATYHFFFDKVGVLQNHTTMIC